MKVAGAAMLCAVGSGAEIEYRLLGPIEVGIDGIGRPLSGFRQELLLAAVVLAAGREVPTDQLVELLWEDAPPRHPEAALRSQVARLRRVVGTDADKLTFGVRGYALRTEAVVDVAQFERFAELARCDDEAQALQAADAGLRLWRSTDLAFSDRGVLQPAAVRLLELRTALIERRAALLIGRGQASDVSSELRALLLERPEHEGVRVLLMEALYHDGRPTEALEIYWSWRETLRDRGLEPAARLRELELRILRDDLPTLSSGSRLIRSEKAGTRASRIPGTSFVGRGNDVEQLVAALQHHRVVTLTGPGGVGKTRLALEVLRRIGGQLGIVLEIDFSAVEDRADVTRLVAGVVGVKDISGRGLLEQVVQRVTERPCLLLLENCEHVVEEVAELVATLAGAAAVTVLATSQRRLTVAGEWLWPVTTLPTAGTDSPAVQLFLDRARASSPHLRLIDGDVERIQRICVALDGLPLGIEIAAAQTSALSLCDLEVELDHRLELEAPTTGGPTRHRTLRAVIEWTYRRLDKREQRALERLSVFVGPFDLTAARAVLSDFVAGNELAACIVQLVERCLLTFHTVDQRGHYRMLQSVRIFGLDRLRGAGELHAAQAAHANWAVELAEQAERDLPHAELATVRRLDRYFDDLRAAHHWLVAYDSHAAMRLIHALHPYAFWHGRTEVFRWAEVVAALDGDRTLRASVKASVCAGAWFRGDLEAADLAARAALAAVTEPASPPDRRAIEQVAEIALLRGDARRAVAMYDRAHQLCRDIDDKMQATWDLGSSALVLYYAGDVAAADDAALATTATAAQLASPSARSFATFVLGELVATRNPTLARAHLEEAVHIAASVNNDFIAALARVTLASLEPDGGNSLHAAIQHYKSAMASWENMNAWFAQLVTLRSIVELLASNGAVEPAATLYGAVIAGARTANPLYGADLAKMKRVRETIERELGEHRARDLATTGERLSRHDVAAFAVKSLEDLSAERCRDDRDGPAHV
jgi:predicted ATPase/DNA-binding SARP family transcriptional activator